jgi:Ca2+/Na+ antiporter
MAVSSSIGSNIFDILVGLPIPWMIKILIVEIIGKGNKGYAVKIKSPYIALYVLLLLFMVFCVICSIHLNGWRLNRYLGYAMA